MKLASKIVASVALLGAYTVSRAESITFGVEIPPIASITVSQGLLVSAKALASAGVAAVTPLTAPFVGAFTVSTNMPKWNIYFSLANNGFLVNQSGNYLMDNAANYLGLGVVGAANTNTAGKIFLKFGGTADIKGYTDIAAPTKLIAATNAVYITNAEGIVSNTNSTLTSALATGSPATGCGLATVCVDQGWVFATAPTTATIGLGAAIDGSNPVNAIAGTYTETLYLTLVTAY